MPNPAVMARSAIGVLIVICLIFAILRENSSKTPNNESRLNRRQFYTVMLVCTIVAVWAALLYLVVPDFYKTIVLAVFFIMEAGSFLFWFYDPFLYILSHFFKGRQVKPPLEPTIGKQNRFAVIGCAHNEEKVVGQLIESVFSSDYDHSLYDLYIICDNCTDKTAEVVKAAGAIPMVRDDLTKRGKSFALSWMFGILKDQHEENPYDAYIVLDADNLISKRFFRAVNRRMNQGHEFMQAYLGCKNPNDSWVSRCYSIAYWLSNLTFQRAHMRLGLSAQMGGTGMIIRPNVLDEIEWPTNSLTEDLLITTEYVLKTNRSACWVHDARIYDEKPIKLKNSIVQRTRWMQGHMNTMSAYCGKLLFAGIKNRSMKQLDLAFYLARPMINICMFVCYAIRWICWFALPSSFITSAQFVMNLPVAVGLMIAYWFMQCLVLYKGHRERYILWIPLQLLYSLTWYPAILRGLIKKQETYWVSTEHTRSLSLEEAASGTEFIGKQEPPSPNVTASKKGEPPSKGSNFFFSSRRK